VWSETAVDSTFRIFKAFPMNVLKKTRQNVDPTRRQRQPQPVPEKDTAGNRKGSSNPTTIKQMPVKGARFEG
jgi:hypothetical protein